MANIKFFAEHNGETVQLTGIWHDSKTSGRKAGHFSGLTPDSTRVQAARMVEYRSNPSKHACDARCLNATGLVMKCECSCGGKNHGRGSLSCEAAAA